MVTLIAFDICCVMMKYNYLRKDVTYFKGLKLTENTMYPQM